MLHVMSKIILKYCQFFFFLSKINNLKKKKKKNQTNRLGGTIQHGSTKSQNHIFVFFGPKWQIGN